MSADNTIGILITRHRKGNEGNEEEYRVAHAQAIEDIYSQPDYPSVSNPVINRKHVREIFGGSHVFHSMKEAISAAERLKKIIGYVEYGICTLDHHEVCFPASDRKRRRRRFFK